MPLSDHDRSDLVRPLVALAQRAGRAIMEIRADGFAIDTKSDDTPVTAADQASEALITDGLQSLAPEIPVVAEEAVSSGHTPSIGQRFFLVDPLDGTREFVSGSGEFTVNIALIENGTPCLGVIVAPALGRTFFAAAPGQAFEQTGPDAETRPIAVRMPVPGKLAAVASRSHRDADTSAYLDQIRAVTVASAGSSLKFCLLASGEADVYPRFGPTCEWDTAAGHAILSHAGGGLCRLDGEPFTYGKWDAAFLNPGFLAWGGGTRPPLPAG